MILSESTFDALRSLNDGQAEGSAGNKSIILHMGRHIVPGHPSHGVLMTPLDKAVTASDIMPLKQQPRGILKSTSAKSSTSQAAGSDADMNYMDPDSEEGSECNEDDGSEDDTNNVAIDLYQLIQLKHLCRLSLLPNLPALRTERQITPSVLDSPIGCMAIAALQVVGLSILRSELSAGALNNAMRTFNKVGAESKISSLFLIVAIEFPKISSGADLPSRPHAFDPQAISLHIVAQGGYLFESCDGEDGIIMAAFSHPEKALRWCLSCQSAMVDQAWPDELLRHELGEELRILGCCVREDKKYQKILHRGNHKRKHQ